MRTQSLAPALAAVLLGCSQMPRPATELENPPALGTVREAVAKVIEQRSEGASCLTGSLSAAQSPSASSEEVGDPFRTEAVTAVLKAGLPAESLEVSERALTYLRGFVVREHLYGPKDPAAPPGATKNALRKLGLVTPERLGAVIHGSPIADLTLVAKRFLFASAALATGAKEAVETDSPMPVDATRDAPFAQGPQAATLLAPLASAMASVPQTEAPRLLTKLLGGLGLPSELVPSRLGLREAPPLPAVIRTCIPLRLPGDSRFGLRALEGGLPLAALLHELGHVLPPLYSQAREMELRALGNGAVAEAYALLFESLAGNSELLGERGLLEPTRSQVVRSVLAGRLLRLRRDAALLLLDAETFAADDATRAQAVRTRLAAIIAAPATLDSERADSTKAEPATSDSVRADSTKAEPAISDSVSADPTKTAPASQTAPPSRPLPPPFVSASLFEASLLAVALESTLEARFGPTWWRSPAAGEFLTELWREGTSPTAEEVARRLGAPLDGTALLRRVAQTLVAAGDPIR